MFTTNEELAEFKKTILRVLNEKDGALELDDFCKFFRKVTGSRIHNWFKQVKKNQDVPNPLRLLQEFCYDTVEVDLSTGQRPIVKVVMENNGDAFKEHLKTMSTRQCEDQLKRTVEHVQGSTKEFALSVDDDEVVVVKTAIDAGTSEERAIQEQVEQFSLYRDFQMIHITYMKLRIVSMYNNCGETVINISYFIQLFKAMFCENFFARNILKHFVSDTSLHTEDFVANFLKRFCTEFLSVNPDMTIKMTLSIPSSHVKFLNQLISALEKLATPGYAVKELDPTPAEMMLLGKAAEEEGGGINTKTIRNRNTFINFPSQSNLNNIYSGDRPTLQEVNERVHQIRNRICREGRCVKLPDVIQELCSFYKVSCVGDLYPLGSREIRREGDIPALYEIIQANGKINAFVQAFVEFRNVCTLHELEEEICKMESKATFAELKLGPLQKQLLVYEFFKFPPDKETIPPITTLEVFRLLWKCQSEMHYNNRRGGGGEAKERDRLTLHQFMDFFIKQHGFNDPFESGVRINSIGLAISVVRKAWFGDMHNIRNSVQKFTKQLCDDFDQHLNHARVNIAGGKGQPGERDNLVQKISGMNLLDGFGEMYGMLQKMKKDACKTLPGTAHLVNFSDITMNALSVIQKDELMRRIFHVLLTTAPLKVLVKDDVAVLNSLGFKEVIDEMVKSGTEKNVNENKDKKVKKVVASKALVTKTIKKWLSKNPELNLDVLSHIEYQVTREMGDYDNFDELGHGSFLQFIKAERKFKDTVENCLGVSSNKSRRIVSKKETNSFVYQCGEGSKVEDITRAIARQFNIQHMDGSLVAQIEDAAEVKQNESAIFYQHAFLCGSDIHDEVSQSERVYFAGSAMKRICSAPYLVSLNNWTNWDQMFQAKLGPLKDFLQTIPRNEMNFYFMETSGNKFIKVLKDCPYEHLLHSLKQRDAPRTSTCILSILMSSCHINDAPIALLANHIQKALLEFAGKGGADSGEILSFCLDCFTLLPFEILCCVIRKLFLSPLAEVYGALNVAELLLNACSPYSDQKSVLHLLGFHLAIEEWKKDYERELEGLTLHKEPEEPVICIVDDEPAKPVCIDVDNETKKQSRNEAPIILDAKKTRRRSSARKGEVIAVPDIETPESELIIDHKTAISNSTESGEEDFHVEILIEDENDEIIESDEEAVFAVVMDMVNKVAGDDEPVEEILDPVEKRTRYCQTYINEIRREQFGVGLKFGVEEEKLINIFRERQGRSLYRLSQELYTKDSHFVLELIQNADDNEYPEDREDEKPTVAFIVEEDKITILNNEKGFEERHVTALCDVGKSTKSIHRKGYIGQKGIGFKSVFRVTDGPQIHSNGFHIEFDAMAGPNGYICPQWIDEWREQEHLSYQPIAEVESFEWTTKIVLPLKTEMKHSKLTSRFHDIHPSLLMFLNRLQTIIIDDKVSGTLKVMRKEYKDENMVELSHNDESSLWLVVDKDIPIDVRDDVKNTGISVAFPIQFGSNEVKMEDLPVQPVFAFLPLRSYGFKFIIQADFEVPSSREDIDKDSCWNQCILRHIPQLVVDAFHSFKSHSYFQDLQGVINYFKFMDVEGHVLGVFKQVGRNIIKSLQRENCLPVDVTIDTVTRRNKDTYNWMIPSSVVVSQPKHKDVVRPELLKEHLGLYYVHKDVQQKIPPYILKVLGVSKMTFEQLVEIAKALIRHFNEQDVVSSEAVKEMHGWIGQWMHIVYKTVQENCDCSQETLNVLKSLNIFALSDGTLVSLENAVVFFPMEINQTKKGKVCNELEIIENDLCILSRALTSKLDQIQLHEVKRLLKDLGVKMMTPFDLIHNIIIPIFKLGKWKEKAEDLLVAFVTYMHQQLLVEPDLFDVNEIKDCIALQTNKGFVRPSDEFIYFTASFGNSIDLMKKFPACNWTLISDVYLKQDQSNMRRKQWQDFFARIGLKNFALLRKKKESIHKSDIATSVWDKCSESWPKTQDDTYVINDLVCPEFTTLLQTNQTVQITAFALELDARWKENFADCKLGEPPSCILENTAGARIGLTYSSFTLQMRSSAWLPSTARKSKLFAPSELYLPIPRISSLFADKINYLSEKIKDKKFITTLGVLTDVSFDKFVGAFKRWREEKLFKTTFQHTVNIYNYLKTKLNEHPEETKQLLEGDFVFLLSAHCNQRLTSESVAEGKFFKVKDLVWEDPSGILVKSEHMNHRRLLKGYYPEDMRDFFVNTIGVDGYPSTKEYLNLIFNISSKTTLPDKNACYQICTLFSIIGDTCIMEGWRDDVSKNWYLPEKFDERRTLYAELDAVLDRTLVDKLRSEDVCDEKIFPTSANKFASLSEKPYLAFNEDLTPYFKKEDNVMIISIDSIVKMLKVDKATNSRHKRGEDNEHMQNMIRCLCFFKACGIRLLSDVYIPPEVITIGMSRGCRKWEQILHDIAPFMQKFIAAKLPSVYQVLKTTNFHEYLKKSVFFTVKNLEVIYRLEGRLDVNVQQFKVSSVEPGDGKALIHVTQEHVDEKNQHENILSELMTLFVGKVEEDKEKLLDFALVPNKRNYLGRKNIYKIPQGDPEWSYPEPERLPPPPPKPVVVATPPTTKPKDGEQKLTFWPPRDPGCTPGIANKPTSVREDEDEIRKKWKQPAAPGMEIDPVQTISENANVQKSPDGVAISTSQDRPSSTSTTKTTTPGTKSETATSRGPASTTSNLGTPTSSKPCSATPTPPSDAAQSGGKGTESESGTQSSDSVKAADSTESVPQSSSSVSTDSEQTSKNSPSERLKRKREPSGMEQDDSGTVVNKSTSGGVTTPKPKKPYAQSVQSMTRDEPDYSAPEGKNIPTNKIDYSVEGFSALDLDTEYEDLPYNGHEEGDLEEGELSFNTDNRGISDDMETTGRLGEELVYKHLCNVYKDQITAGDVHVEWLNTDGESKSPYDLKITFAESDRALPIFIEVKTTVNDTRKEFMISSQQLKFAFSEGSCFHLYRVSNLFKDSSAKIKRLVNLSSYMDRRAVKLYMLL